MSLKQSRRSVSVRGETYDRLASFAKQRCQSMSQILEEQLAALFEVDGFSTRQRVAHGLCRDCGKEPALEGSPLGKRCQDAQRERETARKRQERERGKAPPNPTQPMTRQQRKAAGIEVSTFNISPKPGKPHKAKEKPAPMPKDYEDDPVRARPAPRPAKEASPARVMADPWGIR